jgi:hypothetical protein
MFDLHYESYVDRNVTQARNVLRSLRILLNESLIELYLASTADENFLMSTEMAYYNIEMLASEICASVPQFIDCDGPARKKLSAVETSKIPKDHPHTPNHVLDCYKLLFPLYITGQSKFGPSAVRPWAIKQLHHISGHFCIRNAKIVARILDFKRDANPWDVYAILGSYAFAAVRT